MIRSIKTFLRNLKRLFTDANFGMMGPMGSAGARGQNANDTVYFEQGGPMAKVLARVPVPAEVVVACYGLRVEGATVDSVEILASTYDLVDEITKYKLVVRATRNVSQYEIEVAYND